MKLRTGYGSPPLPISTDLISAPSSDQSKRSPTHNPADNKKVSPLKKSKT